METKICNICNEEKLLSAFYSYEKIKADGTEYTYYFPYCKECAKEKAYKRNYEFYDDYINCVKRYYTTPKGKERKKLHGRKRVKLGQQKQWQRENKDKLTQYRLNRSNKKHEISKEEWENCKKYFNNSCAYCGITEEEHRNTQSQDLHKEHVNSEGLNDLSNCIPSCARCNSSKGIYSIDEWYTENNPDYIEERLNKIYKWLNEDYKRYINK